MPTHRHLRRALALALVVVPAVGCSDSSESSEDADGATTTTSAPAPTIPAGSVVDLSGEAAPAISVIDNSFDPRYVRVAAGATVTFTNNGDTMHNITPVSPGDFTTVDGADFAPGDTATIVLERPGVVAFYCSIHGTPKNGQNGAFEVVAG